MSSSTNSLVGKLGLFFNASIHDMVNQALKAKSVAVFDELLRRARESQGALEEALALIEADQRIEQKKNRELVIAIEKLTSQIVDLLGTPSESKAASLTAQKLLKEKAKVKSDEALASYGQDLETQDRALAALKLKIEELQQNRDNTEQALKIAGSKKRTLESLQDINSILTENGAGDMVEDAERKKYQADAQLDRELKKSGHLIDPAADPSVAAEMERLRKQAGK